MSAYAGPAANGVVGRGEIEPCPGNGETLERALAAIAAIRDAVGSVMTRDDSMTATPAIASRNAFYGVPMPPVTGFWEGPQ